MPCLDDETLAILFDGGIKDKKQKAEYMKHIEKCDYCFDRYFFLVKMGHREKEVFSLMPEVDLHQEIDFMVELDEKKPIGLARILLLKRDIFVGKTDLVLRSSKKAYASLKIQKKDYPDLYFFQETPHWIVYLEETLSLLTVLIEDKLHYRAPYEKKELLLLPLASKYTFQKEDLASFSFKLC